MNKEEEVSEEQKGTAFGFAEGAMLMLVASRYPTLPLGILERVQNGIDKMADLIVVDIDLKARDLCVRDNGEGLARDEMGKAMNSVGQTIKARGAEKYGRYGLGVMAYADHCRRMVITATPKSNPHGFHRWTFDMVEFSKLNKIGMIPYVEVPELWYGTGGNKVWWRTEVRLEGISGDREKNRITLDSLEEQIIDRFGIMMRKRDVLVHLKFTNVDGVFSERRVVAHKYNGISLGEKIYKDSGKGRNFFRLYTARSAAKDAAKGKVLVGEYLDPYRIDLSTFVHSLPEHLKQAVGSEVVEALSSGYFEGEILGERISLDESREKFKLDEALAEYCAHLARWYSEVGSDLYRKVVDARKSDRYRLMGDRTLERMRGLLKRGLLKGILVQKPAAKPPVVHPTGPGPAKPKPKQEELTSFGDLKNKLPEITASRAKEKPPRPEGEKPPFATQEPQRKTEESSDGLPMLLHEVLPGERLYDLRLKEGQLVLNVRHPWWVVCDQAGVTACERFQDYVVVQALLLEGLAPHLKESTRLIFDEQARAMAMLIAGGYLGDRLVQGRAAARRKAGSAAVSGN